VEGCRREDRTGGEVNSHVPAWCPGGRTTQKAFLFRPLSTLSIAYATDPKGVRKFIGKGGRCERWDGRARKEKNEGAEVTSEREERRESKEKDGQRIERDTKYNLDRFRNNVKRRQ
jgi:hypothetical protein